MKDYNAPETIELTAKQQTRLYKLILKHSLEKRISWEYSNIMFVGKEKPEKLLLYKGEVNFGLSVQDKHRYTYMSITKEQYILLKGIIEGKNAKLAYQVQALPESELALDYFEESE